MLVFVKVTAEMQRIAAVRQIDKEDNADVAIHDGRQREKASPYLRACLVMRMFLVGRHSHIS